MAHAPALDPDGQRAGVDDALVFDFLDHAMRFGLDTIFLVLGLDRADLHAGAALDAVVIRQGQLAALVQIEGTRGADVGAGSAAGHALGAAQLHPPLPGLLDAEGAIAGHLALPAADAVGVLHHQGFLAGIVADDVRGAVVDDEILALPVKELLVEDGGLGEGREGVVE